MEPQTPKARIAVAMDRAFSFYYQDSLDLLEAWGAEVVPFSALEDECLPEDADGVYLGGGFPELFAADLAANRPMLESIRDAASKGVPVYGECGGLMYLGRRLSDLDGGVHDMAGLVPVSSVMEGSRLVLGYRELEALSDGPLMQCGRRVRGHEFHWSVQEGMPTPAEAAYSVLDQEGRLEGFRCGSVLASYIHLHLASDPLLAPRFVEVCSTRPL